MKRWIIRSFFIGLLLLCVLTWWYSFSYMEEFGRTAHSVKIGQSKVYLISNSWSPKRGWHYEHFHGMIYDVWDNVAQRRMLGFTLTYDQYNDWMLAVPYWFPTTISAGLLWLVWRKTRARVKGRAFPVELAKR